MVAPLRSALGDSPAVTLAAASTVEIAPPDINPTACEVNPQFGEVGTGSNAVNSNRVIITGFGTINSFGVAFDNQVGEAGEIPTITKQIEYRPDPGKTITLHHNPPALTLLGGVDRVISVRSFGVVASDPQGDWTEQSFAQGNLTPDKTKSGGLVSIINYTASATITIPPFATRAWVRMWGGSGAIGSTYTNGGPGAGSGGYLEKYLTGLVPGNTLIFTRGAGGVPVPTGGGGFYGGDASASILGSGTQTIGTLTANGSKGAYTAATQGAGSVGGTASGGDINLTGQSGSAAIPYSFDTGNGTVTGAYPGVGGARLLSRGLDGTVNVPAGVNGLPGGLIIAWFNDALA